MVVERGKFLGEKVLLLCLGERGGDFGKVNFWDFFFLKSATFVRGGDFGKKKFLSEKVLVFL